METFKRRLMAAFVDCVCVGAVSMFAMLPLSFLPLPGIVINLLVMLVMAFFGFVMLMKDSPYRIADLLDRQSPGKKVMGIRVWSANKTDPISGEQSIRRNLVFAVPYLWLICVLGLRLIPIDFIRDILVYTGSGLGFLIVLAAFGFEIFMMSKDPEGRRWGDKKADTIVLME
ncbi:RDD family protein [Candidatus Ozemobacteraceae bacterium]|nr:RDD family protein [Candidatus Ozemobacteraceae bacterium]